MFATQVKSLKTEWKFVQKPKFWLGMFLLSVSFILTEL